MSSLRSGAFSFLFTGVSPAPGRCSLATQERMNESHVLVTPQMKQKYRNKLADGAD